MSAKDKEAAKQCLILADKFLKDGDFENARNQVAQAQQLDPSNPYAYAFLDRISHFEEQRKKEKGESAAAPVTPVVSTPPPEMKPVEQKRQASVIPTPPVTAPPKVVVRQPVPPTKPVVPSPSPPKPMVAPPAEKKKPAPPPPVVAPPRVEQPKPKEPDLESMMEAAKPVIADVMASRTTPPERSTTQSRFSAAATPLATIIQQAAQGAAAHHAPNTPKTDIESKLDEMKRQIEMLTRALDQERKVREDMNQQQLQGAIKQLRTAMEKAWTNGAPKEKDSRELHEIAVSLGVPEDIEQTLNREVKLEMYSRAVKEVVAKQKLLRNSSRTLEWLRKVYQVTMDEYLEYESKFLLDLVADQYKGTILLVSSDEKVTKEVAPKLKSSGYAVVFASSPENALEKIEKINPHYILCDMEFSAANLSGIKFLHVLRANSKFNYIPFILMCQPNEMSQLKSSELRPTEGYVEKPMDLDVLNAVMNEKLMQFRQYLSSV